MTLRAFCLGIKGVGWVGKFRGCGWGLEGGLGVYEGDIRLVVLGTVLGV